MDRNQSRMDKEMERYSEHLNTKLAVNTIHAVPFKIVEYLNPEEEGEEGMQEARRFEDAMFETMKRIMQEHGGDLEKAQHHFVYHFPAGTVKIEKLPRVRTEHFTIIFPDGFVMYEMVTMQRGYKITHNISFAKDVFPLSMQEKHDEYERKIHDTIVDKRLKGKYYEA